MWKAFAFNRDSYTDELAIVELGGSQNVFAAAAQCMEHMSDSKDAYYAHLFVANDVAILFQNGGQSRLDHDNRYIVDPVADGTFSGYIVAKSEVAVRRFIRDEEGADMRPSAVALDEDWRSYVMAMDIGNAIVMSMIVQAATGSQAISRYTTQAGTFYATSAAPYHELTEAFV